MISASPPARAGLGLLFGRRAGVDPRRHRRILRAWAKSSSTPRCRCCGPFPIPALIFLFIIWYGIGETAKVLLIALATLVPMYLNRLRTGCATSTGEWSKRLAPSDCGAGGWCVRWSFPLALPVDPERAALRRPGSPWWRSSSSRRLTPIKGIGYLVTQASSLQQIPNLVVCIFIYAILGISADVLVRRDRAFLHAVAPASGRAMTGLGGGLSGGRRQR